MSEINYEPRDTNPRGKGLDIASMVLGILSIVCCLAWYVAWVFSVAGLVMGILCLVDKTKDEKGFCIAGVATSGVGLLLAIVSFFFYIIMAVFPG